MWNHCCINSFTFSHITKALLTVVTDNVEMDENDAALSEVGKEKNKMTERK